MRKEMKQKEKKETLGDTIDADSMSTSGQPR